MIGQITLSEETLIVVAGSLARADALRARVEAVLGREVEFDERIIGEVPDGPFDDRAAGRPSPAIQPFGAADPTPPELRAIVREHKQKHYDTWPDYPLPALDGETPIDAVKSAQGMLRVLLLLADIEATEQNFPADERVDLGPMRRRLDLPPAQ